MGGGCRTVSWKETQQAIKVDACRWQHEEGSVESEDALTS